MRISCNRRLFVAFLSAFLGWTCLAEGRISGSGGWETASQAQPPRPPAGQTQPAQAPPLQPSPETPAPGNPVVVMTTSMGDITLELFKTEAPVSVQNFLQYVNDGFYAGTVFHRVRKGFMIQGGGFTEDLQQKPTKIHTKHTKMKHFTLILTLFHQFCPIFCSSEKERAQHTP